MKYIFLLAFGILSQPMCGQVIFVAPPSESHGDLDSVSRKPVAGNGSRPWRPTYMGQPIHSDSSAATLVLNPKNDSHQAVVLSASIRSDTAIFRLIGDSLTQVSNQIRSLKNALSLNVTASSLLRDIPSILPVRLRSWAEYRVSSGFGMRVHPITGSLHNHMGIDLPQPRYAAVYATADGFVEKIIWQPEGLGLAIYITHRSGYQSVYGHLETHAVVVGEFVRRGQPIGQVGSTGMATGPHLHYSVIAGGQALNPTSFCFLLSRELQKYNAKGVHFAGVKNKKRYASNLSLQITQKLAPSKLTLSGPALRSF